MLLLSLVIWLAAASAQRVDSVVIKQVDSLILVSRDLTARRQFDMALEINSAAERIVLERFGRETAVFGSCAFNRGRVNYYKRDYAEAEKWYIEAKEIRKRVLGNEHLDFALALYNLGILYYDLGDYEKSELLHLDARFIREKVLGKEHPDYAASLNFLAVLYWKMGNYEKAELLYLEATSIRERTLGKEHPSYAASLNNLATLYCDMGKYEGAEPLYLEARSIRDRVLGKKHLEYAHSLINLANLYLNMGSYEKVEPLYLEATSIQENALGKEHPDYVSGLNNLAALYLNMGSYEKAESLFLEVSAIREKVLGKEHPDYAVSLNNLANLYWKMGNYEKAEPLYLETRSIREEAFGKEHPNYATSLNNLAGLYCYMGNYEKAEPLYLEARSIREKALGKEHPDYAHSLSNLAGLYLDMGSYEKAETLHLEARFILEKALGKEHPDYAVSLNNLAMLYWKMSNYEKAEPLYLETRSIREKALGKEHPDYAASLNNLAILYSSTYRFAESELLLDEALNLDQSRLIKATCFLSDRELTKYAALDASNSQIATIAWMRQQHDPMLTASFLPSLMYNQSIFYKGFTLQAATKLNGLVFLTPGSQEINLRLKGYRRRLAAEYSKPMAERRGVPELEEKANLAEKELARSVAGYAEAMRQVKWQEVQAVLSNDAIALEFVHFQVDYPKKTDSVQYAVLLLRPGTQQPLFIPLFEELQIKQLLQAENERKADYVNKLYAWADRGLVELNKENKSLYELIWQNIEAAGLHGVKTVYYSPSGILHRLNLGAIPVDDEANLSDRYNLVDLGSTRQLVVPSMTTIQSNDAVLVGGVNFDVDTIKQAIADQKLLASRSDTTWAESGSRGGTWSYLKWTAREIDQIGTTLTAGDFTIIPLANTEASEETIKSIGTNGPSPRILHLATHGFFFFDPEIKSTGLGVAEPVFKLSDNPMIRSGLILAGGNYAWQHGQAASPEKEDGILTAYEISQMNLANTELVVLSACETGLGDIQGNEGVYGLQRAFKIAGVRYLIMSLWQVPDRETMEFMTTFYRNWLEEELPIPDAFRKTQREMRDRFFNPYSWAGFVLVE